MVSEAVGALRERCPSVAALCVNGPLLVPMGSLINFINKSYSNGKKIATKIRIKGRRAFFFCSTEDQLVTAAAETTMASFRIR